MRQTLAAAGFEPLIPPMQFREPGSLYAVGQKRSYIKVCDPDPKDLERVLRTSPTIDRELARLTAGKFHVTGELAKNLAAALSGEMSVSVTFKLSRVRIVEVNVAHLVALQKSMLTEQNCNDAVEQFQKANMPVCIGLQALRATTIYKVETNAMLGADAKDKIKDAIEASVGSSFEASGRDEFVGSDLLYGIKLHFLCVTPGTAKDKIHAPPPVGVDFSAAL